MESRVNPKIALHEIAELRGYCFGFSQKCVLAALSVQPAEGVSRLGAALKQFPKIAQILQSNPLQEQDWHAEPDLRLVQLLAGIVRSAQQAAGIPVAQDARVVVHQRAESGVLSVKLAMASFLPKSAGTSLVTIVRIANALVEQEQGAGLMQALSDEFETMMQGLRQAASRFEGLHHFIPSAMKFGMPYQHLTSDTLQLGWGSKARLLLGSSSDATSMIGVRFAKNKMWATSLLKASGVPVPQNIAVATEQEALAAAERLGFPVVAKPTDRDHGEGATADLRDPQEVSRAYAKARAVSENIMIEQHIAGQEYRLLVVNGRLFWAFERAPARVTGDGSSTIERLIEQTNLTRVDGPNTGAALLKITADEELHRMLQRQGLTLQTVPRHGQVVRLQVAPLVATGGEMIAVFDDVHPDNAQAAIRAARLLRLDIAGIDFLSTDISLSWRENGGRITEVNALPQFSALTKPDIFDDFVQELVDGDGRVPAAVVLAGRSSSIETMLRNALASRDACVGIASEAAISIGGETVDEGQISRWYAAQLLIADPSVDAIVDLSNGEAISSHGLPFDRIDVLAIADGYSGKVNPARLLELIEAHVAGPVFALENSWLPADAARRRALGIEVCSDLAEMAERIAAVLAPRGG